VIQDHGHDTDVGERAGNLIWLLADQTVSNAFDRYRTRVSSTGRIFALKMVRRCCRARKQSCPTTVPSPACQLLDKKIGEPLRFHMGGLQVPGRIATNRPTPLVRYDPDRIGLAHPLRTEASADPDAGEVATKMRAVPHHAQSMRLGRSAYRKARLTLRGYWRAWVASTKHVRWPTRLYGRHVG
jgi:hypothetical protein